MGQRIDVNHENIYYGDFLAVEDVNINIEPNKVTAFIGPSGCGKSTVLRTLDRMHEIIPGAHVEGEVLLEGKNLYDKDVDPVAVRRDVGMVFQRPNPFPTMSIRENVLAGVRLNNHHLAKSDADDLVEWALRGANLWEEVKDRLDNPGIGLSGGQQQRLCIARAVPSAATAGVLVIVGCMMAASLKEVKWDDIAEAIPAFFAAVFMAFSYSISYGIAGGFIMYCIVKTCKGKAKEVHPIIWIVSALFILDFVCMAIL